MKRMNYLLAAAAILAVVGCAKEAEKEIVNPGSNMVTLRASVEDTDTRVSIGNDYAFAFQSGDKVSVLTDGGEPVEFETSDSGTTANFEGSLGEGESVGSYALYPASDNHMADGNDVLFSMDKALTWKADESFMPMLGKVENGSITFKAVGGVMKLIVYNIPSDAAYLKFTATNKKISGGFEIADASVDNPVIVTDAKGEDDNTLTIGFSENYSVNKVFYIPLPTGTIDGFTISFLNGDANVIDGASKTTTATLNVTRNKIILAPALNVAPAEEVVLWSEDFKGYSADDVPEEGTGYEDAVVSYDIENGNSTTKVYNENTAGGTAPEILVAKSGGSFTAKDIPSAGATSAVLTYTTNNNNNAVSTSTEGVKIGNRSKSGSVVTYPITISSSVESFDLSISNSAGSNTRIDNIVLKATVGTAPTKPTIIVGRESETISAGTLNASINGVKLENPLDNLGITATTDADWLSVAFTEGDFETGAKLTATANSYYHESEARTATVILKATGVTKTVTFKQNASIVNNPSALTVTPGDKTFSVTWDGDDKAASYSAVYSSTALADPSEGIALSVSNDGTTFTAVPTETLVNGTTYYIYVRVATLVTTYAEKYAIASGWTEATAIPLGIHGSVDSPYPISDAIEIMDDLENNVPTADFYYLAGTLDQNPSYYGSGQLTFTFVDEDENSIKAFNCLGLNGTNFSSKSDLKAGDEVVVYGNLEKYVSGNTVTYEIINAYLVKLTPASTQGGQVPGSDGYCFNITSYSSIPSGWTSDNVVAGSYYRVNTGGSLVSPAYNIEEYSKATVSIKVAKYGSGNNPAAVVSVSYDGGDTWSETKTLTAPTSSTYLDPQTFELSGTFTKNVVIKLENRVGNAALRVQNYSFRVE